MGKTAKVPATIALDSNKQNSFTKSMKKLQKKVNNSPTKPSGKKPKSDAYLERGLIYISHLPHGFLEQELKAYFKQFGLVTNVRVLRSHTTGKPKGAAFVEFNDPDVAKIAAETMDNYLMFKRRLEVKYIEPQDRHSTLFKIHLSAKKYPAKKRQTMVRRNKNSAISNEEHQEWLQEKLKKLKKNNMLDCCQVYSGDQSETEVKTEGKQQKIKKNKTDSSVTPEPVETFSDDEIVISKEIMTKKKTKSPKKVKSVSSDDKQTGELKQSLRSIQKPKEKLIKTKTTNLKPQIVEKIVTKSVTSKGKKAKLILDPSLMTEVDFSSKKSKKTVKKVKK